MLHFLSNIYSNLAAIFVASAVAVASFFVPPKDNLMSPIYQPEQIVEMASSSSSSPTELLKLETEKAKADAEAAKALLELEKLKATNSKPKTELPVQRVAPAQPLVVEKTGPTQEELSRASNNKDRALSLVGQIIVDAKSLDQEDSSELSRMNGILNTLVGKYDKASDLFNQITIERRDRFIKGQGALRNYIDALETIKSGLNGSDVMSFLTFNADDTYLEDTKFINDAKTSFQSDKANYDDSYRTYQSIQATQSLPPPPPPPSPVTITNPQLGSALTTLQTTLSNIENETIPMSVISGQKEKAVQDWIKLNPSIFSSSLYINQFNSILVSYGLYYMAIIQ